MKPKNSGTSGAAGTVIRNTKAHLQGGKMKIFKVSIKDSSNYDRAVEKIVPETDVAQAVQSFMPKVSKTGRTVITLVAMGDMPDNYVDKNYRSKKEKTDVESVPPF